MSGLLGDTAAFVGDNVGLLVQRILEHVQLSVISLVIAMLVALPVALVMDRPWMLGVGAPTWGALLGLSLLSTALGVSTKAGVTA